MSLLKVNVEVIGFATPSLLEYLATRLQCTVLIIFLIFYLFCGEDDGTSLGIEIMGI